MPRLSQRLRRARKSLRRRRRLAYYSARRRRPVDPSLAVFAAYWNRGYACNPKAIYEKARELVPDFHGVWVVARRHAKDLPEGVPFVVSGSPEYFDVLARAKYFVNNVNFPNHLVKRDGTVHVMTHHGTPLKTMGLDLREAEFASRKMDFDALLRRCGRWDFSVSSNPLSTEVWKRVYPVGFESLDVGYPRNDLLAAGSAEEVAAVRDRLGLAPGAIAVLYAPTHREYRAAYEPPLDLGRLASALSDDHVLMARLHYFYDEDPVLRELHREGRVRDVSSYPAVEELCLAADVLVTDYSSIMFDYAVLDRPIVIHAPDWDEYRARRGTYFDLTEKAPGPLALTEEQVAEAVRAGDPSPLLRTRFRAEFCPWDDGHASERVVRRVWGLDA